jgi:peptide/nickel transport system substrate-binding protein
VEAAAAGASAPGHRDAGVRPEFSSYNPNTTDGAALANSIVLGQVIRSFYTFKPDGTLTPDETFGTYEKTSDNPLTVKYTFNDKAKWSDGKPVDCDDAVLMWMANSGVTGDKGFEYASNAGFNDMAAPACKAGEKTFTVTQEPFGTGPGSWRRTPSCPRTSSSASR